MNVVAERKDGEINVHLVVKHFMLWLMMNFELESQEHKRYKGAKLGKNELSAE